MIRDCRATPDRNAEVANATADLYRYFGCTTNAEFLYVCVVRTVEEGLPREIAYLHHHGEAQRRIMEILDMPERLIQDLVMFIDQNGGKLPKTRRENELAALTDEEVSGIGKIYTDVFGETRSAATPFTGARISKALSVSPLAKGICQYGCGQTIEIRLRDLPRRMCRSSVA